MRDFIGKCFMFGRATIVLQLGGDILIDFIIKKKDDIAWLNAQFLNEEASDEW